MDSVDVMDDVDKGGVRLQFHLNTCAALTIILGLLTPAVLVAFRSPEAQSTPAPAYLSITFLLGCLGIVSLLLWRLKDTFAILYLWLFFSVGLGVLGVFIPFGDATVSSNGAPPVGFKGFCGEGVPVPLVIWDGGVDYPGPLALFINPIAVFILGAMVIGIVRTVAWIIRKIRNTRELPE